MEVSPCLTFTSTSSEDVRCLGPRVEALDAKSLTLSSITMNAFRLFICLSALATGLSLTADVVRTKDGSILQGRIVGIDDGFLDMETNFAGAVRIELSEVLGLSTDEEAFLRLEDGREPKGKVLDRPGLPVLVSGLDPVQTPPVGIRQLWRAADEDPVLIAQREAKEKLRKKWKSSISFDLTGSSGNSEDFGLASQFKASYGNEKVTTKFHLSSHKNNKSGETTTDETKAGVEHSSFFGEKTAWYVKSDLESDKLEDVNLRSTSAAGIKYALMARENQTLNLRSGLGFRFESYENGNESAPALDIGLEHTYKLNDFLSLVTELDYVPSIQNFPDYRVTHDTGLEIPLSSSGFWKLRTGIANDYNSRPASGKERLDVRYYTRIVFLWE